MKTKEHKPKIQFLYVEEQVSDLRQFKDILFEKYRLDFKTFQVLEIGFRTLMSHSVIHKEEQLFGGYIYEYLFDYDKEENPLTDIFTEKDFSKQLELIEIILMNYEAEHDSPFGSKIVGVMDMNYTHKALRKALKFNLRDRSNIKIDNSSSKVHPNIADYLTDYIHNSYIYWQEVFKYYFPRHQKPHVPEFISTKLRHEHLSKEHLLYEWQLKYYEPARIRDKIEDVKNSPRYKEREKYILKSNVGTEFIRNVIEWEIG